MPKVQSGFKDSDPYEIMAANKVEGTAAYTIVGNKLGTIKSFMIDKLSGQVVLASMAYGGMDQHYKVLPWTTLVYNHDPEGYLLDVNLGRLELGPAATEEELVQKTRDSAWVHEVHEYYDYDAFLVKTSMLENAKQLFETVSPLNVFDRDEFKHAQRRTRPGLGAHSRPMPDKLLHKAATWLSIYPPAIITGDDGGQPPGAREHRRESALECIADVIATGLITKQLGFDGIYIAPVSKSGGLSGYTPTPSTDGNFDPISLDIDKEIGTLDQYKHLVEVAAQNGCVVIDNIIALHTGQGPDFLLALRGDRRYKNLYIMADIEQKHWTLLPEVHDRHGVLSTALVSREQAAELQKLGYIPGSIDSCDASKRVKDASGWSATGKVIGCDKQIRRWVYLHFFKPSQPVLNDDHPDCQAIRLINGVIISNIMVRGATIIRMDAVPFSIEAQTGDLSTDNVYTPSAIRKANQRASLIRQLGGFSFQELNAPITEARKFIEYGTDLAYDFFTRTPYLHALLVGDATLLNFYIDLLLGEGIQPRVLIHDLQNHDEFTYQLPELESRKSVDYHGLRNRARNIQKQVLAVMRTRFKEKSWAALYRREADGVATTMVGFLCACLNFDPYEMTDQQIEDVTKLHLLAVRFNALQPGAFCLSMWDLVGALPLRNKAVEEKTREGDFRWMNRGAVDLTGKFKSSKLSCGALPLATPLYGSMIEQVSNPTSFVAHVQHMLNARREYRIPFGELTSSPPDTENHGVCIVPVRLDSGQKFLVNFINFSHTDDVEEELDLDQLLKVDKSYIRGQAVTAIGPHIEDGHVRPYKQLKQAVTTLGRLTIQVPKMSGTTLVIESRAPTR